MTSSEPADLARRPELPSDFAELDFGKLWRGRERTTEVEGGIVADALRRSRRGRVLEIGVGEGRLTPFVQGGASEYVGVDQRLEFLERTRDRVRGRMPGLLIEANLYHLPLVESAVASALLIRVYNFLTAPVEALAD